MPRTPFGVEDPATKHREPLLGVQAGERVEAEPEAVGAVAALRQKDFKRMLAFSSISQVGYIVLAAGLELDTS